MYLTVLITRAVSNSMTHKRICVVGAGVIGLSSAVRIQNQIPDADITIVADKFSPNTTSDGSAGFWEPHLVNPIQKQEIRKWGQETFDHLLRLASSEEAGKLGAQLISGYNFCLMKEEPFWKDQVLAYRKLDENEKKIHPEHKDGVFFTTVSIDVKSYLPWLMQKFKANGGKVQFRTIASIYELSKDFDVIVNCVGVQANRLLGDEKVKPVRGQVMTVYAPWIKHFIIDFDVEGKDNEAYIIPGRDCVTLGGTGQEGNWNTDVDSKDANKIFESCVKLVPSLKNAKKISDWVGLRPGRTTVRLEIEEIHGSKKGMVIHNYGHAGSGVTLHWGCAGDTVQLVQAALKRLSLTSSL